MVSIVAFQAVDLGSIPGQRTYFFHTFICLTFKYNEPGHQIRFVSHMLENIQQRY